MKHITYIEPTTLAKHIGFFGLFWGFIYGILYGVGGIVIDAAKNDINEGTILALLAIIGAPIIFSTTGCCLAFVTAFTYNAFAKKIGGIRIEIK